MISKVILVEKKFPVFELEKPNHLPLTSKEVSFDSIENTLDDRGVRLIFESNKYSTKPRMLVEDQKVVFSRGKSITLVKASLKGDNPYEVFEAAGLELACVVETLYYLERLGSTTTSNYPYVFSKEDFVCEAIKKSGPIYVLGEKLTSSSKKEPNRYFNIVPGQSTLNDIKIYAWGEDFSSLNQPLSFFGRERLYAVKY